MGGNRDSFLSVYTRATVCLVAGGDASVSVRELGAHLADHVARAAAGETVTVTRQGRPDVVVGPPRRTETSKEKGTK
jgi:prevent-host-death family protein